MLIEQLVYDPIKMSLHEIINLYIFRHLPLFFPMAMMSLCLVQISSVANNINSGVPVEYDVSKSQSQMWLVDGRPRWIVLPVL